MPSPDQGSAFNGIDFKIVPISEVPAPTAVTNRPSHFGYAGIVIGQGMAFLNGQTHTFDRAPQQPSEIVSLLRERLPKDNELSRIVAVGIAGANGEASQQTQEYWGNHAIVPFHLDELGQELTPAEIAALVADKFHSESGVPKSRLDKQRRVHPDLLVPIDTYRKSDRKDTEMAEYYAARIKAKGINIDGISATEIGGGVAKKHHRVTSAVEQLGVNLRWRIQSDDDPARYDITKEDIHNVLQLVEERGRGLTPEKVAHLAEWGDQDFARWEEELGESDVIIIHDPQPVVAGLIRHIREKEARDRKQGIDKHRFIIYRSHTQPDAEACDTPDTPQNQTWNLLWENGIKDADYIIAHPLEDSIPANVPREKVGFAGATEDRFDGLNMDLPEEIMDASMHIVDDVLANQIVTLKDKEGNVLREVEMHQAPMPWDKGYTLDFARFDESKGKPELLHHQLEYIKNELEKGTKPRDIVPIAITGNMATDDPSAAKVAIQLWDELQTDEFDGYRDYFRLLIAPTNDFIANTLMKKARAYIINSTKEGYETVVKAALMAKKPVIATEVGGPKIQLRPITFTPTGEMITEDRDSFLVDPRDNTQAAGYLSALYNPKDKSLYNSMSEASERHGKEPRDTTMQAVVTYLYLIDKATSGEPMPGNLAMIHAVAEAEYDEVMREASLSDHGDVFVSQAASN